MDWEIGVVARLASGSPGMTVYEVVIDEDDSVTLEVVWWDERTNDFAAASFPAEALHRVDDGDEEDAD